MGIIASGRVVLRFAASRSVPPRGRYDVYANDGAGGGIDYDNPLNRSPIAPWPADGRYRGGFGLGPLGEGGFGYGVGGVGFARGMFGAGPFGRGTHTVTFTTGELADGDYDLAVVASDPAGNPDDDGGGQVSVSVAATPAPPGVPAAAKDDPELDEIALTWDLSSDDEDA